MQHRKKGVTPISEQSVMGASKEHVAWESWHGNWLVKMLDSLSGGPEGLGKGILGHRQREGQGGMVPRGNCK